MNLATAWEREREAKVQAHMAKPMVVTPPCAVCGTLSARVELVAPRHVIGKSTVESIQSGCVYGYSGQVDALVDRFQAELGECAVVATGGLAEPIITHSRTVQHYEPWLTLAGLRIVFERNR